MIALKRSLLVAVLSIACPFASSARAADVVMDDATKKATARALEWLAKQQSPDGSFSDGGYVHNTAITAFAALAFMSQGHLPNQGLYGPEVAKAAKFLIASQREDGYLVGSRGGNMYCHGMATLALSEMWGQTGDDEILKPLKKAVDLIVRCQNQKGGWRYEPAPTGDDISVTIMQVMALRSAINNGLNVPKQPRNTMEDAIKYVKACYNQQQGGFTYQPYGGAPGFARTAAGCCVLYLSGKYDDNKYLDPAVKFLQKRFDQPDGHFFYGHYYAAHAMYQRGGKEWEEWYGKLNKVFMTPGQQTTDGPMAGSWSATRHREVGPVYQTAIAVICLSTPLHYLPVFQR
ncbi:MAG: terpene cyclase/mutase family protein [Planctomycetes bacterium]|nr:terpene cyclase/mutase family protein [Planctomycetota bacterium]